MPLTDYIPDSDVSRHSTPIDRERTRLSDRIIPSDLAHRIAPEYARANRVLPVEIRDGKLLLAVCDPGASIPIRMVARFFDMPVELVAVSDADMEIALDRAYGRLQTDGTEIVSSNSLSSAARSNTVVAEKESPVDDAVAVRVLDALLLRAVRDGASDIHIEPFERILRARLRIDGALHEVGIEQVSPRALAARCKILANLDTAEMRRPQDGRFHAPVEGRSLDVRISSVPTRFGEKIVLRLLDRNCALLDLAQLGMEGRTLAEFRRAIAAPHGLILVTGPTGSGKTTTLYAALSERNERDINITTIEDPIEYDLYGVTQIQVHSKIELGFAKHLRHVLRQDPDVILVGEIRDKETAEVAIQAAMTGHLVLSTLHTNSAVGAVARLLDMGIEPFLVADAVVAVLAQRLVRRLCTGCGRQEPATIEEAREFVIGPGEPVYRTAGCARCLGTGYRGRIGLYELFSVTPTVATMIRSGCHSDRLRRVSAQEGWVSLREDGLAKARGGVTTIEEVERVS